MKERQIDYRSYSNTYAVVYQDLELKCPEIELCWTTLSDQAIKPVQNASTLGRRLDAPRSRNALQGEGEERPGEEEVQHLIS